MSYDKFLVVAGVVVGTVLLVASLALIGTGLSMYLAASGQMDGER